MASAARRSFGSWLLDVACGLLAFAVAWAVRFGLGAEFRAELPRALITFVAVYLALRLGFRLYAVQSAHAKQTAAAQKAAADVARRAAASSPPPPPRPPGT